MADSRYRQMQALADDLRSLAADVGEELSPDSTEARELLLVRKYASETILITKRLEAR